MDTRKQLKITVLSNKIDQLQKDIDDAMNNIETMSHEFAKLMQELQELQGNTIDQNKRYEDLLSRMSGDKKNPRSKYDACNTSEEMLHMMMQELDQTVESDDAKGLPDVGDNSEIWDRMAQAQQKNLDGVAQATDYNNLPDVGDNSEIWDRMAQAQQKNLDDSASDDFDTAEDENTQSITFL